MAIYPNSYDAQYRLALGYSYSCAYQGFYCYEGIDLMQELHKSFPEKNLHFKTLDSIFSLNKTSPIILSYVKQK